MSPFGGPHQPRRPEWTCRRCLLPYPCPAVRHRLVATYGLTPALAEHAVDLLYEAVRDLRDVPPLELFERFIAWTAPPGVEVAANERPYKTD